MRYDGDYAAAARAKAEEGYGALGRYAKEHHGGDLRAAAKELARQKRQAEQERCQDVYEAPGRETDAIVKVRGLRRGRPAPLRAAHYTLGSG